MHRRVRNRIILFIVLVLINLALTLSIPPDVSVLRRYNLEPSQILLLKLIVTLPLIAIWLLALYGFVTVYRYASSIRKHKDGNAFLSISTGLGVLAFGLPLQSISVSFLDYMGRTRPAFEPASTIISNYIALGIILTSFYILHKGALQLNQNLKVKEPSTRSLQWQVVFGLFSLLYVYLVFHNPARSHPTEQVAQAAYYLPDWLIFTTVVLPYIAVWYLGIQSAYNIYLYQQRVKGILYKQALRFIASGIVGVVAASMLVRFIASQTTYLSSIGLRAVLLLIYMLLISVSIGYIFIASGARRLHKMENV